MKRFRFPLEALLAIRQRKLGKLEAEVGALQRKRMETLESAAALEQRSAEARESIGGQHVMRGADLRLIDASSQAMLEQAHASREQARRLEHELVEGRKAVLQARRDAEMLEKLRERDLEEWRREVDREEEALASELHLARRTRIGEPM